MVEFEAMRSDSTASLTLLQVRIGLCMVMLLLLLLQRIDTVDNIIFVVGRSFCVGQLCLLLLLLRSDELAGECRWI